MAQAEEGLCMIGIVLIITATPNLRSKKWMTVFDPELNHDA